MTKTLPARRTIAAALLAAGALAGGAAPASAQAAILWDSHHGLYHDLYSLPNQFSNFGGVLTGLGYTITQSPVGVVNLDLSAYEVIVISALSAAHSAYSPAEVQKIQAFVQSGGGLLIMGENSEIPKAGVNSIGAAFDMTFNTNKVFPSDTLVTNLATHDVSQGIQTVYMRYGGEIQVGTGAAVVGTTQTNQSMIASAHAGRVIGLGDSNLFDDAFLGNHDNVAFVGSLFAYLTGGCVSDLGPGLAGAGGLTPELDLGSGSCGGLLTIELADALGGATAFLLAGTQSAAIPSVGGTVWVDVTAPPAVVVPLPLGGSAGQPGAGGVLLAQNLSASLPLTLTLQFAVFDPNAPFGVALSNGVRVEMAP
ncbi:MAG: DUF4350 domain-containing protein [Planctomycetota bacterium JB042]